MFTNDVESLINDAVLCWLATVDAEGQPNCSPKEVFVAYAGSQVLIADIASPQSRKNIEAQSLVCVSFVDIFKQRGYKLKGQARYVPKSSAAFESYWPYLAPLLEPDFPVKGIIQVTAHSYSPIMAPSYTVFQRSEAEMIRAARKTFAVDPD